MIKFHFQMLILRIIYPHLKYDISIWVKATQMKSTFILQKDAFRTLLKQKKTCQEYFKEIIVVINLT